MPTKACHKVVRDRIPEIMQAVVKACGWMLEELEQLRADKDAKRGWI